MRLTKLRLKNFRSFKSSQTLEFSPLTMLFGPNSVGKSSVLMALAYVQQILTTGQCNPQHLDALNKKVGGFQSLVNGNDLEKTMVIEVEFEVGTTIFEEYRTYATEMSEDVGEKFLALENIDDHIEKCSIELDISWSRQHQNAYVKNYRVWLNNEFFGLVESSEDLKNTFISELNTRHHLLNSDGRKWDWDNYENFMDWVGKTAYDPEDNVLKEDVINSRLEDVLNETNPNQMVQPQVADIERARDKFVNSVSPVSIQSSGCGALPILGVSIITDLIGDNIEATSEHFNFLAIVSLLSQGFVLPLDKLKSYLETSLFIGPLRVIPDVDFIPNPYPTQSGWVDGTAAWDHLHAYPQKSSKAERLLRKTNEWLTSGDLLNSGYKLINTSASEMMGVDNLNRHNSFHYHLDKRVLYFQDIATDTHLNASQLGTGVSQVLPIIVASHLEDSGVVSIEQPELHIHPRLQVELADLFLTSTAKGNGDKTFLIETHSEHLILRLLRRVRESNALNDNKAVTIDLERISVLYISPQEDGVKVEKLEITPDGDFEKDWPHGFFDERDEELF